MIKNGIRTYYIRQHLESFKRNQSCGIRLLIRSKLPHRVSASTSIHRSKKKFPANKRDFSEKIGYVPSSGKSTLTSAQNERCKSIKIESNTKLKSDVKHVSTPECFCGRRFSRKTSEKNEFSFECFR